MSNLKIATIAGLVILSVTGCSEGTGPGQADRQAVTLRVAASSLAPSAQASGSVTVAGHTLVLSKIELVLRDIKFKRVEGGPDCDDLEARGNDKDDCEKFATGPMLLDLPLGSAPERVVTVEVDAGTYRHVEFRIHKPEDDNGDASFLAAHPDLRKVSVRVTGQYDGNGFVYISDLSAKQRNDLTPPLVVGSKAATDVTLKVDVATWFAAGGLLIDPASALKGQPNDNLVRDNIRRSFHWFEDKDHDGKDDR